MEQEQKNKGGRPSIPEFKKQVTVRFSLNKLVADRWPADKCKQLVLDTASGLKPAQPLWESRVYSPLTGMAEPVSEVYKSVDEDGPLMVFSDEEPIKPIKPIQNTQSDKIKALLNIKGVTTASKVDQVQEESEEDKAFQARIDAAFPPSQTVKTVNPYASNPKVMAVCDQLFKALNHKDTNADAIKAAHVFIQSLNDARENAPY